MVNKVRRMEYTKEIYSVGFTSHLLEQLFDFISSDQVSNLNLFSEYDKAGLLCAIEHLESLEELQNKK
jgi:hypothetical protein